MTCPCVAISGKILTNNSPADGDVAHRRKSKAGCGQPGVAFGGPKEDPSGIRVPLRTIKGLFKMSDLRTVLVIVVAFNSDVSELQANLKGIAGRVDILISDNSTNMESRSKIAGFAEAQGMKYVSMGMNAGIGYAQNRAFEHAIQADYKNVLLLDDDSRISSDGLATLLELNDQLVASGAKIAAVSAQPVMCDSDIPPHRDQRHVVGIRDLMSSGSLISVSALHSVGGMDEALFVDYVDYDWGWRAQAEGFSLFVAPGVHLEHALGEGSSRIVGLSVKLKAPIRHYYQTRNCLLLLSRGYVPLDWKVKELIRLVGKCVIFSLFVTPRWKRFVFSVRGFVDAFTWRGDSELVRFG